MVETVRPGAANSTFIFSRGFSSPLIYACYIPTRSIKVSRKSGKRDTCLAILILRKHDTLESVPYVRDIIPRANQSQILFSPLRFSLISTVDRLSSSFYILQSSREYGNFAFLLATAIKTRGITAPDNDAVNQ